MTMPKNLILVGLLMVAGACLALLLKPTRTLTVTGQAIDLATLVPMQFGTWRVDQSVVPVALPTELQATQDAAYDQALVRTYVSNNNERVMLTVAYGGSQSRQLQVHRPEVCYAALGFQILSQNKVALKVLSDATMIPAMQLVAAKGWRNEPITYWIRIGDKVVRGNVELGLARISFGLRGYVADGLLFRASSITDDNRQGFALQQRFVGDLVGAMNPEQRKVIVGSLGASDFPTIAPMR